MDLRIAPNKVGPTMAAPAPARSSEAQAPAAPSDSVQVNVYQQDPFVAPATTQQIERSKVGTNLSNDRVKMSDTRPQVKPDADGNYITEPGSDGESQVTTFVVTSRTIDMWQKYRGSEVKWSFGGQTLDVTPHKREGMNAYYSRWEGGTNYFFQKSAALDTVVKTSNSLDVVAHETGHALLDGMKPGFLSGHDRETGAFHEAFGDCLAMLATLQDPLQNQRIIDQTGGNLRKQNELAHLAEEFGAAVKRGNSDPNDDHKTWLRNSLNSFTYVPPESLGDGRGDDDTLGGEIHSFARLFAGAFYDCIEAAYLQSAGEGVPAAQALKSAADVTGPLLAHAIDRAPANKGRFKDIALGLIAADKEKNGGKLGDAFKKIFTDRKIIKESDIKAEAERRAQLPELHVDRDFASGAEATAFVTARAAQLGLPEGVDFETVSMTTDENGEQVVNLLYSQEVPCTGCPGLEGVSTDVTGGITLAFDAKGKLSEFRHEGITEERISEEMEGIAHQLRKGQVLEQNDRSEEIIFTNSEGKPYQSVVRGGKLTRIPSSSCDCGCCTNCSR